MQLLNLLPTKSDSLAVTILGVILGVGMYWYFSSLWLLLILFGTAAFWLKVKVAEWAGWLSAGACAGIILSFMLSSALTWLKWIVILVVAFVVVLIIRTMWKKLTGKEYVR